MKLKTSNLQRKFDDVAFRVFDAEKIHLNLNSVRGNFVMPSGIQP